MEPFGTTILYAPCSLASTNVRSLHGLNYPDVIYSAIAPEYVKKKGVQPIPHPTLNVNNYRLIQ